MTSREFPLNAAACRLLQNIMPGLETAVVFQEKVGESSVVKILNTIWDVMVACCLTVLSCLGATVQYDQTNTLLHNCYYKCY